MPSVHGELLGLDCGLLGLYHIPDQHYAFMLLRWGDNTTTVGYSDDVKLQAHLKALTKAEAVTGLCQTDTNITEELINKIISLTEMPYSPLTVGFTQTYQLKELFECSLLEGTTVPPHDDGIEGYRVFLMLRNPGYIIRGRGQTITRQRPGAGFVLNLKMTHEVHAIDPNSNPSPWLALTMGPYLKAEYNPVAAMTDGLVKFNTLIHCCQSLG
ncbi:hypothetical protein [Adonisia turfae]|nr:hypothetical protein [Adonisia turfae]